MKTPTLLFALSALMLGTAHAQKAPARRPPAREAARAHAVVAANGKAIGQKFITKSTPIGSRTSRTPWTPIQ